MKKILTVFATMLFSLFIMLFLPFSSLKVAAETEESVGDFYVSGGKNGVDYEYVTDNGGAIVIKTSTQINIRNRISGKTANQIRVNAPGQNVKVVLHGVRIETNQGQYAAFDVISAKSVTIVVMDNTTNTFKSFKDRAGIQNQDTKLFIRGQLPDITKGGTIYAYGGTGGDSQNGGAGIGGGNHSGSNIYIQGGTVYAYGGNTTHDWNRNYRYRGGAGIGGGGMDKGGTNINISGGTVHAQGSSGAAGIGGGARAAGNCISISGGEVYAQGGDDGAGIGGGDSGDGNNITISGGKVVAQGGRNAAGIGGGEHYGGAHNINITGGNVTALGGSNGGGIGGGLNYYNSWLEMNLGRGVCQDFTMTGGYLYAKGNAAADIGNTNNVDVYESYNNRLLGGILVADRLDAFTQTGGIWLSSRDCTMKGDVEITSSCEIPAGYSLKVKSNEILTIAEGVTLKVNGAISNDGMVLNNGTIDGACTGRVDQGYIYGGLVVTGTSDKSLVSYDANSDTVSVNTDRWIDFRNRDPESPASTVIRLGDSVKGNILAIELNIESSDKAPITVGKYGAEIQIGSSSVSLKAGSGHAGIENGINPLKISCFQTDFYRENGECSVYGGANAAGIGGGNGQAGGNITIERGNLFIYGGENAAAIGGGNGGNGENINISTDSGLSVSVIGKEENGFGIGGGQGAIGNNISITSRNIYVTGYRPFNTNQSASPFQGYDVATNGSVTYHSDLYNDEVFWREGDYKVYTNNQYKLAKTVVSTIPNVYYGLVLKKDGTAYRVENGEQSLLEALPDGMSYSEGKWIMNGFNFVTLASGTILKFEGDNTLCLADGSMNSISDMLSYDCDIGIFADGNLTVEGKGSLSISTRIGGFTGTTCGIKCNKNLTVSVEKLTLKVNGGFSSAGLLSVEGGISIDGTELDITPCPYASDTLNGWGIYAKEKVTLNAVTGKIVVEVPYYADGQQKAYGIYADSLEVNRSDLLLQSYLYYHFIFDDPVYYPQNQVYLLGNDAPSGTALYALGSTEFTNNPTQTVSYNISNHQYGNLVSLRLYEKDYTLSIKQPTQGGTITPADSLKIPEGSVVAFEDNKALVKYSGTVLYTLEAVPAEGTESTFYEFSKFTGITPEKSIYGDVTISVEFAQKDRMFTLTWKNTDGTILEEETYGYGAAPKAYAGPTPTIPENENYTYSFKGWDRELTKKVVQDEVYVAQYEEVEKVSEPEKENEEENEQIASVFTENSTLVIFVLFLVVILVAITVVVLTAYKKKKK